MSGKVIGKIMNHGFAGEYARTPDMIIVTRSAEGEIVFGSAVIKGTAGIQVKTADATTTASNFVGVCAKAVKTAYDYESENAGKYIDKEPVAVMERGSINVINANGDSTVGGKVYVAITTSAFTGANVGDFCASATGTLNTDYIELDNAQWGGETDVNGVAELVLLTRANA